MLNLKSWNKLNLIASLFSTTHYDVHMRKSKRRCNSIFAFDNKNPLLDRTYPVKQSKETNQKERVLGFIAKRCVVPSFSGCIFYQIKERAEVSSVSLAVNSLFFASRGIVFWIISQPSMTLEGPGMYAKGKGSSAPSDAQAREK